MGAESCCCRSECSAAEIEHPVGHEFAALDVADRDQHAAAGRVDLARERRLASAQDDDWPRIRRVAMSRQTAIEGKSAKRGLDGPQARRDRPPRSLDARRRRAR